MKGENKHDQLGQKQVIDNMNEYIARNAVYNMDDLKDMNREEINEINDIFEKAIEEVNKKGGNIGDQERKQLIGQEFSKKIKAELPEGHFHKNHGLNLKVILRAVRIKASGPTPLTQASTQPAREKVRGVLAQPAKKAKKRVLKAYTDPCNRTKLCALLNTYYNPKEKRNGISRRTIYSSRYR
jgi:hypothetical protein